VSGDVQLFTIGNLTIDDIVRWPDGQAWMGQAGGNALFAALGAQMWLERVGLLVRVGSDYAPEQLDAIRARGLRLGLVRAEAPTLHDWALYEADGGRQFINHLNSGSNEQMTLAPEEIASEYLSAPAYHLAPVPLHQQLALARRLRRPGVWLSIDPHYGWIDAHLDEVRALVELADFFLPSRLEARLIYGADAPTAAARALAAWGPRAVVVKLEAEGSLVYDSAGERLAHVPIYPAEARDTTGAGDAYCGGFLAGYILSGDPVAAAQHGTVSASYVVETVGALATPRPNRADARARLTQVAAGTREDHYEKDPKGL
jgi:ribokinase